MSMEARNLYLEGIRQFQADRLEDAAEMMRHAMAADPAFEDAYEGLGLILARRNKLDEAIAVTRQLVEINADHLMAHVNLSVFYNKKGGMIEEAEAEQAKARILGWKADLKKNAESQSTAPAAAPAPKRETFLEVLKIDPEDAVANFSLGKLCLAEGEPKPAREYLETVVRVQPDYSAAYPLLGEALESLAAVDEAREVYRSGIEVATQRGDLKPKQQMEKRLAALMATQGQSLSS